MTTTRLLIAALCALVLMSACGKRGELERPEGSAYPRSYPPA